jgi:hypothetical protein
MPAIPLNEAIERLAKAVEEASPDDLAEIYAELYPENPKPDPASTTPARLAKTIAAHIREGIEPEEVVDLWNVVFPTDRDVSYDEEDGTLRYNKRRLKYAEP